MGYPMQRWSGVVTDDTGKPRSGASVTVRRKSTAAIATVFSDEAFTAKTNPLTSDSNGLVWFYGLDDDYTVTVDDTDFELGDVSLRTDWSYERRNRYVLEEWFQRLPQLNASIGVGTNLDWEIQGTNASNDDVTFFAGGGIKMETDGAAGDDVILMAHEDASQSAWDDIGWYTDNEVSFEVLLTTGGGIGDTVIWAGFKLTSTDVIATDDDQVFVRFSDDSNSGKWLAISSRSGTDDQDDTGVTVASDTSYLIQIIVDASRVPRVWINGVLVATLTALQPSINLIPVVGVSAFDVAGGKYIITRYIRASGTY